MSLPSRLLGANPSIQVSTLLSGSLTTPSAKRAFKEGDYDSISTVTLGSDAAYAEITSIPSTYTHLQIRGIARTSHPGPADCRMQFNGDTGNNYAIHYLRGDSSSIVSANTTSTSSALAGKLSYNTTAPYNNVFNSVVIDILDYANTNKYKTSKTLGGYNTNGNGTFPGLTDFQSSVWMSTSAITSIRFFSLDSGTLLKSGSTFALYGITSA